MFKFGVSSKAELRTVHPDLQRLAARALELSLTDFRVLQGMRSREDQIKAFLGGFSKIDPRKGKVGRHMVGCAIDFAVIDPRTGKLLQSARPDKREQGLYVQIREAFWTTSRELNIPIRTLEKQGDLGHVELLKAKYPDNWKERL